MNFILFLLLNAVLLLRPDDLFPELAGLRLYLLVIVPCVLLSLPRLLEIVSLDSLQQRPVAVCVLLFFSSTIVSLVLHGRIGEALFGFGQQFAKIILYYFLIIAVLDSKDKIRLFIASLVILISGLTTIAIMQHYGIINLPSIKPCPHGQIDPQTGEIQVIYRLVSGGLFSDPNDLCLILGLGILSCVYGASTNQSGPIGLGAWLLPIPLFAFAMIETHSKGGLLGILSGASAYLYSRYGGSKAIPYAIAGSLLVLTAIGGRQGDISGGGTAHQRLMFWSEGMTTIFARPLSIPTGLGIDWFVDETGHVAHNSFITAYVELGVFGGGAFLGAFYCSIRMIGQMGRSTTVPPLSLQARHYGFAILVGYAIGCYSLSRNFVEPTYLILGLSSAIFDKFAPAAPEQFQVNSSWFSRMAVLSAGGLIFFKVITQGLGQIGV